MDFAFNKADSRNLPKVDMITRDSYGDVEVGRNQSHCIVRGEVTPEHKVKLKLAAYKVSITLNEVPTGCD
ncbi:hypothetical protein M8J77_022189 [Diaphorina citri]|nr:hypothetical protein M8J77_022189 [Diaphorina citri]